MDTVRAPTDELDPFSAGPYARLQAAIRLKRPGFLEIRRRALTLAAIAWVPLLLFSAMQGLALGPTPRESFLLDPSAYARYLVAIPLFVIAEAAGFPQFTAVVRGFTVAGLIADADQSRYEELVRSTRRLLTSRWVEIALVAGTYAATFSSSDIVYPVTVSTWVAPITDGSRQLSIAGWWRLLVSQPLFVLLALIWAWRLALWARFLWGVSRLHLRIVAAHPDRCGGLQFIATSLRGFLVLAFGISASAAGGVGQAILIDHHPPQDFQLPIVALVIVLLVLFIGPLMVFFGPLLRAKVAGMIAYGGLADAVGRQFEGRWLQRSEPVGPDALSVEDFSATTDLYSVVANVYGMRLIPVDRQAVLRLATAVLAPFLPVVLAVLPLKELLARVGKLVM